jgi:hypothetical protein
MVGFRLAHVPPEEASVNVDVLPAHINGNPEISAGNGFIVIGRTT